MRGRTLALAAVVAFLLPAAGATLAAKTTEPAATANAAKTTAKATAKTTWKTTAAPVALQSLSGTMDLVSPNHGMVYLKASNGTSYDFKVTHATKIMIDGRKGMMKDLRSAKNKDATVKYVAMGHKGNLAKSITITG